VLYAEAHGAGPSYYLPTAVALVRNAVLLVATVFWLREQLRTRNVGAKPQATFIAPGGEDGAAMPESALVAL